MLIEGPYGKTLPLHHYEIVLFIIGGSGIIAVTSYIQEHIARTSNHSTRTTSITLVWTTRQSAVIRSIAAHELAPALLRSDIRYDFHATSPDESSTTIEKDIAKESDPVLSDLRISYGWPNITEIINGLIEEVSHDGEHIRGGTGSHVAVLACGPAGMVDEARMAVYRAKRKGVWHVEYFEEVFGW